jgi:hypothetical protein
VFLGKMFVLARRNTLLRLLSTTYLPIWRRRLLVLTISG